MPATPFHCNWCRSAIGTYQDTAAPGGPFAPNGVPAPELADRLRTGTVARLDDGFIVAYPCPHCGRNNLLQLPNESAGTV